MGGIVVLDLIGGVALMLWGLHMVHSGVMRAFGADLRRVLAIALKNRIIAFLAGLGVTAALQSSTATAIMTASFSATGAISLASALAIMLGANVGTTLIVQLLSFDITAIAPLLLVIGLVAFRRGGRTRTRDLGRVAIGLGLLLLALHIMIDTLAPAEQAPAVRALFRAVTGEPILTLLIGAALAWAAHSSVAVVFLAMSLAYSQFLTTEAAFALVLGANLGTAINPLLETGNAADPASRRLPVGNLMNRLVGCALMLPLLGPVSALLAEFDPHPARLAADFHTVFNVALAALFLPLLSGQVWLLNRVLPSQKKASDPSAPLYLDESAIAAPGMALTCAARETLRMADVVETMLRRAMTALMTDDRKEVAEVSRMDDTVDRLDEDIKLYVTKVTRESLDERDSRRAMAIVSFTINLEHIGDIIDKNLMELAAKKIKRKLHFSRAGAEELTRFHTMVSENLKLAFSVFLSEDVKLARRLIEQKTTVRDAEISAAESHLARLRDGKLESIESSSLHLDVLRDLKRIHSHICSVAYPVLEAAGELQPSRLKAGAVTTASAGDGPYGDAMRLPAR
jgi:phosphate:Na+ symporter